MSGIKDKVAIIGMGCSRFGERFNDSREDLILEAVQEALDDAGLTLQDIDAFWFGSFYEMHGTALASVLKPDFNPILPGLICKYEEFSRAIPYLNFLTHFYKSPGMKSIRASESHGGSHHHSKSESTASAALAAAPPWPRVAMDSCISASTLARESG